MAVVTMDKEEDFVRDKAAATTKEERQALSQQFGEYRRTHRLEDVAAGRRAAGTSVVMHQIMWARWAEVAEEHELVAREAFASIVANPESGSILDDFRASLVAITGAAYAIEARQMRPVSWAHMATSTRFRAPSFRMRLARWALTVLGVM
jgi:hypothetical protein